MGKLRAWRTRRKEQKAAKYADKVGWMDRNELEQLRRQQSPLRSGGRRRG